MVRQEAEKTGLPATSLAQSDVPSFSIGIPDANALRAASAYGRFAVHGWQRDPYSMEKVLKGDQAIYQHEDKPKGAAAGRARRHGRSQDRGRERHRYGLACQGA